jgi:hypothetical protein
MKFRGEITDIYYKRLAKLLLCDLLCPDKRLASYEANGFSMSNAKA